MVVGAISAINAPDTLEGLLEYKSVILENVYLSDLPEGFLANIEAYVGDYGCGLVCCGGEDSFALGGYRESVLEKILPVDMELREQMQKLESSIQPSMELVAKQYAADSAAMALPEETAPAPAGGEIDLQA